MNHRRGVEVGGNPLIDETNVLVSSFGLRRELGAITGLLVNFEVRV